MSGWEGCQSIRAEISEFHPLEKGEGISPRMVVFCFCFCFPKKIRPVQHQVKHCHRILQRHSCFLVRLSGLQSYQDLYCLSKGKPTVFIGLSRRATLLLLSELQLSFSFSDAHWKCFLVFVAKQL